MKNYKMKIAILILGSIALLGCDKAHEELKTNIETTNSAHPTNLVGSLIRSDLNSLDLFAKDVLNDRENFKTEIRTVEHEMDQYITNTDGSFASVIYWHNKDNVLEAKGIAISVAQPITPDNLQVLKRLALRLNDSENVEDAILKNKTYTGLNNGAGITIKSIDGRTQYEIY